MKCVCGDVFVQLLGAMFQEFLTRKEDYLRALRGFLREVVRVIRNEFNFTSFIRSLMQERSEAEFTQLDPAHKVAMQTPAVQIPAHIPLLLVSIVV